MAHDADRSQFVTRPLWAMAHAHSGDKGEVSNISLIPYRPEAYDHLLEQITTQRVQAHFAHRPIAGITRFELPNLPALNYVIEGALEGGVNASLNLDGHGQSLSFYLLEIKISAPKNCFRFNHEPG